MKAVLKKVSFRFWAVVLALPALFFPLIEYWYTPLIFWTGLLCIGIPHGALDHHIQLGNAQISTRVLFLFVGKYLLWMLAFLGLWLLFPLVAILFFIIISAYHFGMVDFKHPSSLSDKLLVTFYGINLLLFLLLTHQEEVMVYWQALRLPEAFVLSWSLIDQGFVFLFLFCMILCIRMMKQPNLWWTILLLILGVYLPLLLVFGLYFVFQHALQSSLEIKHFLKVKWKKLILMALPFSSGAYFVAILVWISIQQSLFSIESLAPYAFLFLGMLTLPHVVYYSFEE